tara:strand:+ start:278 stop:463 length:186 start_codon:yes stop_codon:yes gene_type:complete
MTYDLKIEKNPNCKRISQYVLNFCFFFDEYDQQKCDKYQELLKIKCSKKKENVINILDLDN